MATDDEGIGATEARSLHVAKVVSRTLVLKRLVMLYTSLSLLGIVVVAAQRPEHLKFVWQWFPWS